MNHFFAIPISQDVAAALHQAALRWQSALPPQAAVRWEAPENYHVTLNFLGNLSKTRQPEMRKAVEPIAAQTQPFTIHFSHLDAFPHLREPGVLWAGLAQKARTTKMSQALDLALTQQGFVIAPHSFVPHLTLGRCQGRAGAIAAPLLDTSIALPVTQIALLETLPPEKRRKDSRLRYNTVHTFPLGTLHSSMPLGSEEKLHG